MYHKRYTFLLIAGILLSCAISAGAQNRGFVQSEVIKVANITSDTMIYALGVSQKQTSRVYFDGLGRPLQSVAVMASPGQKDIIQPAAYDALGTQPKSYLPYVGSDGSGAYRSSAISEQATFYSNGVSDKVADDSQPWSQQVFENSPLQRLLKAGSVGDGFQTNQHYKTLNNRPDTTTDYVVLWLPDGSSSGYYGAGKLWVTDATDEQSVQTVTFSNSAGRMMLKRQMGPSSTWLDTYYIYNEAGQISTIVPPKATALMQAASSYSLSVTGVDKLLFKYVYDYRGRLIEKTVPGAGVMCVIYDPLSRPVLMQDANMRAGNKWMYIKYDIKGRAVSQGVYTDATHTSRSGMQSYVDGLDYSSAWCEGRSATQTNGGYYTNNIFPTSNLNALSYAYYDDYDLNNDGTADYSYQTQSLTGEAAATALTRGMLTAVSKHTVGSGLNMWLTSVCFYDKQGNAIQTRSNNQLNTAVADSKTMVPDFTGKPLQTKAVVYSGTSTHTDVLTTFSYDHVDRVTAIDQNYNAGSTVHVASYTYNELGQIVDKKLHYTGSAWLQSLDYRYNIRGQLTSINNAALTDDHTTTNTNDDSNDVFGLEMFYEGSAGTGNTAFYNGRLSALKWMTKDASGIATNQRNYNYAYDELNRLTAATYREKVGGSWNSSGAYDEKDISYDANGNILKLRRNTLLSGTVTEIDSLNYSYDGNQLKNLSDLTGSAYTGAGFKNATGSTSAYTYDDNGNLTADPKKGITLAYNVLNRTDKITVTAGTNKYINYTYDSGGQLIRKEQYDNTNAVVTTDYIGGFIYIGGSLSYFAAPEGRVRNSGGTFKNEYVITDTQGNARISFEDNGSGSAVVRQENSYYPFGLVMGNSPVSKPSDDNKHLYNAGAELQDDYGDLPGYYQTFYRNYDAAIGRFIAVDPMAAVNESLTTYEYANNNPGMLNDPMGDLFNVGSEDFYKAQSEAHYDQSAVDRMNSTYDAVQEMVAFAKFGVSAIYGPGRGASGMGGGGGGGRKKEDWDGLTLYDIINTIFSDGNTNGGSWHNYGADDYRSAYVTQDLVDQTETWNAVNLNIQANNWYGTGAVIAQNYAVAAAQMNMGANAGRPGYFFVNNDGPYNGILLNNVVITPGQAQNYVNGKFVGVPGSDNEGDGKVFDIAEKLDLALNLTTDMLVLSQVAARVDLKQIVTDVPILKQLGVATGIISFYKHGRSFVNKPNWKDGIEMAGQIGVWGLNIVFPEAKIVTAIEFGWNNGTMIFDGIWDHYHKKQ